MAYYNQNPPMSGPPPPPMGYPPPGYQGPPPPQPQAFVTQAPPAQGQQGSGAATGVMAGCLGALGCLCCLEICCCGECLEMCCC